MASERESDASHFKTIPITRLKELEMAIGDAIVDLMEAEARARVFCEDCADAFRIIRRDLSNAVISSRQQESVKIDTPLPHKPESSS